MLAERAELRKIGDKMDITDVVVEGGTAWCKWQVGDMSEPA